jgi:hypothetical protein
VAGRGLVVHHVQRVERLVGTRHGIIVRSRRPQH